MFETVEIWCEANVRGEVITVRHRVDAILYDNDAGARQAVRDHLRRALMEEILKRWRPVIHERR